MTIETKEEAAFETEPAVVPIGSSIVFYDGVCGLCNRTVRFVLARDRERRFHFASLQSDFAADTLRERGHDPADLDSMYVLTGYGTEDEEVTSRASAIARILRALGGGWRALALFDNLPDFLLDLGYGLVARTRYRLFGRYDSCPVPSAETRDRFIDL